MKSRRSPRPRKPREFSVIIERDDDGWYVATVPAIRGCHTQARSLDTLINRVREAITACQDDSAASSEFIGVQRVRLSA